MRSSRLEAFSDGVMAIIITVMVLALPRPNGFHWRGLDGVWPTVGCYLLSFLFVGIYWNNHHHLFALVRHVNPRVMWLNLALLFTLSLLPYVTDWMGASEFHPAPVTAYALVSLASAAVFTALGWAVRRADPENPTLAHALGPGHKEPISIGGYAVAAVLPLFGQVGADAAAVVLAAVAVFWIVPNRRVQDHLEETIDDLDAEGEDDEPDPTRSDVGTNADEGRRAESQPAGTNGDERDPSRSEPVRSEPVGTNADHTGPAVTRGAHPVGRD